MPSGPGGAEPLAVLRRLRRPSPPPRPGEHCDLCSEAIGEDHAHLVEVTARSLRCVCRACWLLFTAEGAGSGRLRPVPADVHAVDPALLSSGRWEELELPVGVAFMFRSSLSWEVSAFYPGPAGATESLLPLGAFDDLAGEHEELAAMEPDVEALLVRVEGTHREAFIAPIDTCYELAGVLRRTWRGFDGGQEARRELDTFFEALGRRARPPRVGGRRG